MSLPRYAQKRDANEPELIQLARAIGAHMVKLPPLDWWCGFRGRWVPVEIKTEKGDYTDAQVIFLADCKARGLPVWTWRDELSVYAALGAQRTA